MSRQSAQRAFQKACASLEPAPPSVSFENIAELPSDSLLLEVDKAEIAMEAMQELLDVLQCVSQEGMEARSTQFMHVALQRVQGASLVVAPLIPSMESFEYFPDNAVSITMEALRDSIKKTIKSVMDFLIAYWRRFFDYIEDLTRSTALIKVRAKLARTHVNDIQGRFPQVKTLDVARFVPLITTDRMPVIDYRRVSEHMVNMNRQLERVRVSYAPMVIGIAQEFITSFAVSPTGSERWLESLNRTAGRYNPDAAIAMAEAFTNTANSLFPIGAKMGRPLPGRRSLVVVKVDPSRLQAASTAAEVARVLQSPQVQLAELRDDTGRDEIEMEMEVLSITHMHALLDAVEATIREIDRSVTDDTRRVIRTLTQRLDIMSRAMGDMDDGTVDNFRAGMAYARTLVRWCKEPFFSLLNHSGNVCNNVIRLCNLNAKAYMPDQEGNTP